MTIFRNSGYLRYFSFSIQTWRGNDDDDDGGGNAGPGLPPGCWGWIGFVGGNSVPRHRHRHRRTRPGNESSEWANAFSLYLYSKFIDLPWLWLCVLISAKSLYRTTWELRRLMVGRISWEKELFDFDWSDNEAIISATLKMSELVEWRSWKWVWWMMVACQFSYQLKVFTNSVNGASLSSVSKDE